MNPTFLKKYLDVRFTGELAKSPPVHKGTVITISRDTGCDGMPVVKDTIKQLNAGKNFSKETKWKFVSKEIFEESAKKLNVKPEILDKLDSARDRTFVEEIINSFSTENYPSEFKLKKTYREVIESAASQGGVIILGRAGVAIVKHNKRNLHVKLTAPLEWRIKKVAKEYNVSEAEAKKHIQESDKRRQAFKKYYMGRKVSYTDYDLVLNVSTLTHKQVCSVLVKMIEERSK